jgi:tetratricopeptide (TPR) repeat protein
VDDVVFWYHGLAAAHTRRFDVAIADFRLLLDRALVREQADSLVRGFHLESNEVRYVLANIYQRGLRAEDAVPLYQETLVHDLSFYMAHAQLADIYQERNQWVEAIEERRRAVAATRRIRASSTTWAAPWPCLVTTRRRRRSSRRP